MIESEKKILLTQKEYDFLKKHRFAAAKSSVQVNYYYDTDSFELNRKGITCRIREKDGICMATIKEHRLRGDDCSVENSFPVKDCRDDSVFTNIGLSCKGSMETLRSTYAPCVGVRAMLDCSAYLGITDYELEIEYDRGKEKPSIDILEQIAAELAQNGFLPGQENFFSRIGRGKNKSERFFCRKAKAERHLT